MPSLRELVGSYDPRAPLERASTIPASWYVDPGIARSRATHRVRVVVAGGRARRSGQRSGTVSVGGNGRRRTDRRRARRRRRAARVLQRLPPPCGGGRHRARGIGADPPLSLSRVDLRRSTARSRARPDFTGVCDFDRSANGLVPAARRALGRLRSGRRRSRCGAARARPRRRPDGPRRASGPPDAALDGTAPLPARLQLEGLRRQLSRRRLSRAASA